MIGYFEQLVRLGKRTGISLEAACRAEGLPRSTYWRWTKGATQGMSKDIADRLTARMKAMEAEREQAAG